MTAVDIDRVMRGAQERRAEQGHRPNPGRELPGPALHGLAGRIVEALGPHTESDPAALLLTFLTSFGAAVGRGPHALADGAEHPARLFVVLVGATSKGRKGTAWQQIRRILVVADRVFVDERVLGGFGSGESMVDAAAEGEDHRLFVVEPEWGRLLAVGRRDGATISPLLRQAWDGDRLAVRSRAGKAVADGAHVAVLGHVTSDELRAKLLDVEIANGYANRHLFVEVRRSKLLPSGGNLDDAVVQDLGHQVRSALGAARKVGMMRRTRDADERWKQLYQVMAEDDPGGMVAALIARDAPQVLRLSVLYALLDGEGQIGLAHVEAAWAVWTYCRDSVASIFGARTGDPIADRLLDAARAAGSRGLTTTEEHDVFARHVPAEVRRNARHLLVGAGLATVRRDKTAGRTAEVLIATDAAQSATSATSARTPTKSHLTAHPALLAQCADDMPPTDEDLDRWEGGR